MDQRDGVDRRDDGKQDERVTTRGATGATGAMGAMDAMGESERRAGADTGADQSEGREGVGLGAQVGRRLLRRALLGGRARVAGLVVVGLLVGLACGDGVRMIGDAMVDAGEALQDAGDAMAPDAQAQILDMEVACDQTVVSSSTGPAGELAETTWYFAEVAVPGIGPTNVRDVTTVVCDVERFGDTTVQCPVGWTCMNQPAPFFDCAVTNGTIADGRIRYVCGSRSRTRANATAPEVLTGQRYRRARFIVE